MVTKLSCWELLLFSRASRPSLGPTLPLVEKKPGAFFPKGLGGRNVKLTTHLLLLSRLKMSGAVPPLPICHHGVHISVLTFTISFYIEPVDAIK